MPSYTLTMEELFYRYNPWWEGEINLKGVIERKSEFDALLGHLQSKRIVFLSGLRRVGKTTLMKLLIRHLIKKEKVKSDKIFYISLDDYSLREMSISKIIDEYRKIHKLSIDQKIYVFLDEITYAKDFEIQLKNIYDSQNVKIFASSSSASLMKSKKQYLTGRSVVLEILPLFFEEYLEFKGIKVSKRNSHLMEKYFEDYLRDGGLPEYVLSGEIGYIKELVDDIIKKDIAAVYGVKNYQILQDMFLLLMERAGKSISINKVANILGVSPDTAKRYLDMFAETNLIYLVPRYGKTNETILSPKKIYAADLGIRVFFTGFRDKGSLFENYVYLKIKGREPRYVYDDGTEIDFITNDKVLIEVKYNNDMSERQKKLFQNFQKMNVKERVLINGFGDLGKV